MVEFALSSVVLLLLVGGLVDIGRALFVSEALSSAAREGARHGVWFDTPTRGHLYLDDAQIKAAVDAELAAVSLPASVLKNPGTTCPAPTDGNGYHNPPYANSAYPPTSNQAWLYICYANTPGLDFFATPATGQSQQDLNVIVLYSYGPLTPLVAAQFGIFHLAVNVHMTVQGT
jgi:Flp pilus assembly protein TadG